MSKRSEAKRISDTEQGLFDLACAGQLDEKSRCELQKLLRSSATARRRYLAYAGMQADLFGVVRIKRVREQIVEKIDRAESTIPAPLISTPPSLIRVTSRLRLATVALAIAAGLMFVAFGPHAVEPERATNEPNGLAGWSDGDRWPGLIATIRRVEAVRWSHGAQRFGLSDLLRPGDAIRFEDGLVEIEFRQGAVVVLEGPAHLVPDNANGATLLAGKLAAVAPPWATGFRVDTPGLDVIDHGTEFAVSVEPGAGGPSVNVVVTEGEVELVTADKDNSGRRLFAGDGVRSKGQRVEDGDDAAARLLTDQLPNHPELKNAVVVGDRWLDWLPGIEGTPRRDGAWRHYTNSGGRFGNPSCYEELVWESLNESYRPAGYEERPHLNQYVRVHRDGGHPGKGRRQGFGEFDRYSISGFVVPEDGVYRIEAGWLERKETKEWKLDQLLDVAVHVNDEPIVVQEFCNRNCYVKFNGSLGERKAGDIIYVGVGPSGVDHNDRFRWGFYVVREVGKPPSKAVIDLAEVKTDRE